VGGGQPVAMAPPNRGPLLVSTIKIFYLLPGMSIGR
jgi:hypothetical protein